MVMQSPLLGDRFFRLTMDWRLVGPVVDLLGPDINLHDQKIPIKPPGFITPQRWHQDWAYEEHDRPELAAVLLYLDETGPDAGATKVAPGTHRKALTHDRADNPTKSIPDEVIEGITGTDIFDGAIKNVTMKKLAGIVDGQKQ